MAKNDEDENVIRVSFKNTEFEQNLKKDILDECIIIGKSVWMKLAAYEKIQRDRNKIANNTNTKQNTPVINSLDQLFKIE
jgi:hypothetical protein